jgi:hypothetical protein
MQCFAFFARTAAAVRFMWSLFLGDIRPFTLNTVDENYMIQAKEYSLYENPRVYVRDQSLVCTHAGQGHEVGLKDEVQPT